MDFATAKREWLVLREVLLTDFRDSQFGEVLNNMKKYKELLPTLYQMAMIALVLPVSTAGNYVQTLFHTYIDSAHTSAC